MHDIERFCVIRMRKYNKLNIIMQHSINSGVKSNFVFSSIKFRGPISQRLKKREKNMGVKNNNALKN